MAARVTASKNRLHHTANMARLDPMWKPVMSQGVNSSLLDTILSAIAMEKSPTLKEDISRLVTHLSAGETAVFKVADVEFVLNELAETRAELAKMLNANAALMRRATQKFVEEPLGLDVSGDDFDGMRGNG